MQERDKHDEMNKIKAIAKNNGYTTDLVEKFVKNHLRKKDINSITALSRAEENLKGPVRSKKIF